MNATVNVGGLVWHTNIIMKHSLWHEPDPKVGGSEAVWSGDVGGGCCGVREVGIDVGQQVTHDCRHPWTHVLCREAGEVATQRKEKQKGKGQG